MEISRAEVLRRRLTTQGLTRPGPTSSAEVVSLLACVQSQEWAHGFWSLGMRTADRRDYLAVQREFDAGDFLRTHILRPTWHYVTAEDVGWILAATSHRVHQRNSTMYSQSGLDPATRQRAAEVMLGALSGGAVLTRPELAEVLADSGIQAEAGRLAYVIMSAELDGLIVSGPLHGAAHTYVRMDERLAERRVREPEHLIAELLYRFLAGHGPATLADFTRWSSINQTDAHIALEENRDRLASAEVEGLTVWWSADAPEPAPFTGQALLVPLYDELTLSYPKINFAQASGHPHPPGEDLFRGSVIIDDRNVGLWKRTVRGRRVAVDLDVAASCSRADHEAARAAAGALADFLGRGLIT